MKRAPGVSEWSVLGGLLPGTERVLLSESLPPGDLMANLQGSQPDPKSCSCTKDQCTVLVPALSGSPGYLVLMGKPSGRNKGPGELSLVYIPSGTLAPAPSKERKNQTSKQASKQASKRCQRCQSAKPLQVQETGSSGHRPGVSSRLSERLKVIPEGDIYKHVCNAGKSVYSAGRGAGLP